MSEWISIDDELPLNISDVDVLINKSRRVCNVLYCDNVWYVSYTGGASQIAINNNVTHWMPVPQLPV